MLIRKGEGVFLFPFLKQLFAGVLLLITILDMVCKLLSFEIGDLLVFLNFVFETGFDLFTDMDLLDGVIDLESFDGDFICVLFELIVRYKGEDVFLL